MTPRQRKMITDLYAMSVKLVGWEKAFVFNNHWETDDYQLSDNAAGSVDQIAKKWGVYVEEEKETEKIDVPGCVAGRGKAAEEDQGDQGNEGGQGETCPPIPQGQEVNLNSIGLYHRAWVQSVGWADITDLEALAMIASEIGEAADEWLSGCENGDGLGKGLVSEVGDIVLRVMSWMISYDCLPGSVIRNLDVPADGSHPGQLLLRMTAELGKAVNDCRGKERPTRAAIEAMGRVILLAQQLAVWREESLLDAMCFKLSLNKQNGTRGRVI